MDNYSKAQHTNKVTYDVRIRDILVAFVLGKGGATIKKMRADSRACIHVPLSNNTEHRMIRVIGSIEQVNKAIELIHEEILELKIMFIPLLHEEVEIICSEKKKFIMQMRNATDTQIRVAKNKEYPSYQHVIEVAGRTWDDCNNVKSMIREKLNEVNQQRPPPPPPHFQI